MSNYKSYGANVTYIDPDSCGSTVGYRITDQNGYFDANVELSDCNRKIDWSFDKEEKSIDKIDAAITMLTEFRREFIKARKAYLKDNPEK